MGSPFMIQSANGALTIDIRHAIYTEGTGIQGYPPGGGGIKPIQPNQSWQRVPDPLGSGHYLIVSGACNLCIGIGANVLLNADVTDDATDRGVKLTLQAQEPINNHYQLWDFLPPTGGAGNAVFIQNPQTGYVIELQSQSMVACPLIVNPRRISNETYQLWTAVPIVVSNFLWPACSAIAAIGAPSVAALVMNPLRSEWLANSAGSSPTAAQRRLIMRETVRTEITMPSEWRATSLTFKSTSSIVSAEIALTTLVTSAAVSAVFFVLAEPMVRAIPAMVALTAGSSLGFPCFAQRCA
jgi:hypothetical protein